MVTSGPLLKLRLYGAFFVCRILKYPYMAVGLENVKEYQFFLGVFVLNQFIHSFNFTLFIPV